MLNNKKSTTVIKKHGSEIFLSPRTISPHQHLECLDHVFRSINKPVVQHPYELASIKGFDPVKPWSTAKAALAITKPEIILFPTVEELDNEIDSWPDSISPFISEETPRTDSNEVGVKGHLEQSSADHTTINSFILNAAVLPKTIHTIINEIIRSEDRLFFYLIYHAKHYQERVEVGQN